MHIKFLLALVFIININYAMQESEGQEHKMLKVTSWKDIEPFAGRIIAYKTDSFYIGNRNCYRIYSDESIKFGYVFPRSSEWEVWPEDKGGTGYNLARLLLKDGAPGNCALIDRYILKCYLFLRLASQEEIMKIHNAIKSEKAEFEYIFEPMLKDIQDFSQFK